MLRITESFNQAFSQIIKGVQDRSQEKATLSLGEAPPIDVTDSGTSMTIRVRWGALVQVGLTLAALVTMFVKLNTDVAALKNEVAQYQLNHRTLDQKLTDLQIKIDVLGARSLSVESQVSLLNERLWNDKSATKGAGR